MAAIRRLFDLNECDVGACSDEQIADALLELCPHSTSYWLSAQHLTLTAQHLNQRGGFGAGGAAGATRPRNSAPG